MSGSTYFSREGVRCSIAGIDTVTVVGIVVVVATEAVVAALATGAPRAAGDTA